MKNVVLITGGSSGIGKAIGEFLTHRGYKVYGTSRNAEKIKNHPFKLISLDVLNAESIKQAVNTIIQEKGRLDVLINNAGMGITGPIEETPIEEMKHVFDTNFFGAISVIQEVLPIMRKQKKGFIINITSIGGYMGLPYRGVYSATKGALSLISETLSMELNAFNIKVANVAPGDFATNIASGRYHAPVIKNSPYAEKYQLNLDLMNQHVNHGSNPVMMAHAVYKILKSNHPKVNYKVGNFMQKFSIILKRLLPDKVYEKLLMNHYKL